MRMAIDAEIGDVQWLVVVPVMPLQTKSAPAPGTTFRPRDQPELLAQRGGVTRAIACGFDAA